MENTNLPGNDKNKSKKTIIVGLAVISALAIFILVGISAYKLFKNKSGVSKNLTSNNSEASQSMKSISQEFKFPEFQYKKSTYSPSLPAVSAGLSEMYNLANFEKKTKKNFSSDQKDALAKNNFFIASNTDQFYEKDPSASVTRSDDWTGIYDEIGGDRDMHYRAPENSVFVSTDYLLHVYHRLLEKEFEYIEQKEFYPRLGKISNTLLDSAINSYNSTADPQEKASLERVVTYFAVPSVILNSADQYAKSEETIDNAMVDNKEAVLASLEEIKNKLSENSYNTAKEEINLIMDANGMQNSPLFGKYQQEAGLNMPEDYTQFGPRSHYSKNPILRTYFRSMMWYGRQNLLLKSSELTRDAINITQLVKETGIANDWEAIYIPTTFFVGKSDDLGLTEYGKVVNKLKVNGKNISAGDIASVQNELKSYKNPQIMSSVAIGDKVFDMSKQELQMKTKGFRFMGQRFTPDAFIFSSLTQGDEQPDPETGERLPSMPTALMVTKLLGNKTTDSILNNWIDKNAPDSKNIIAKKLAELKSSFDKLTPQDWTQNIYWGWLYTLKSLSEYAADKTGYPIFMKNDNWGKKDLAATLGSWTELKHDTLLYAKQSYSEMGGGGEEDTKIPPVPKGYVEPNVEFFDRIIPLVKMTSDGLDKLGLLQNSFKSDNDSFLTSLEFFRTIAISELENKKISDEDFEKLRMTPGRLDGILYPAVPGERRTEDGARSALIADVHTDVAGGQILYEASGIPNYIYVAVKDANGTRLTKGLVYSYWEFTNPLGKRLTDLDWKEWNYSSDKSKIPASPDWVNSIVVK